MSIKKLISTLCIMALSVSMLAGCTKENDLSEGIELIEPVGVTANYAVAERQDLVSYKTYGGKVVPKVTEISFSTNQRFDRYGILPGNEAKKGDTVIYASTEDIDKKIKALKEKIASNDEKYEESMKDFYDKSYYELEEAIKNYAGIVNNFETMSEAQKAAYNNYASEYTRYKYLHAKAVADMEKRQESIKETQELYQLDRDYDTLCLKQLNNERKNVLANARENGTVVAIGFFDWNNYIAKDVAVAATGDFSELRIKCDMVYKSEIRRAIEYYAIVNGKRYEVEYVEPETADSGAATSTESATSYSTFLIKDESGEVKAGDFAVVVVVSQRRENALVIPTESIKSDTDGSYVYLYDGDKTSYTPIKTGIKSGFYTEVLSGLSDGDRIVSEFKIKEKTKTQALTKGKINVMFNETGYIFYPKYENITNPIEYGVTYITEVCVKRYERVEKGQILARIKVSGDTINIKRQERNLQRAREDLAELEKDKDKNAKLIKYKQESIADLEKLINEMKSDASTTLIKAPYAGIITSVSNFEEGDILQPNQTVCQLADENNCYIFVEDKAGQITCGNTATIKYDDADGNASEAIGEVVMVSNCALSSDLDTGYNVIRVSKEDFAKMAASNRGFDGWWMRSHFDVTVEVRSMDNVVLIPKSAVTVESGVTYVTILDENNKPTLKSFIAGGSDNFNYWVVEGLSEGTKICLE
ncbi:MAG: hypothetical protein J5626_02205 [Lachnospiraceae bacterium]|nr:hypothetical protein [Lachnospiraceae bacterium]